MTDDEIEQIAVDVLETHEIGETLPVDPLFVARQEDIDLLPGRYDNCFDGRIEYRRGTTGLGRFYLFYAEEEPPFRPEGRVRFSIAHELGHYYLPSHRLRLLEGAAHGSQSDFVSDRQREREADRFAARLLMPRGQRRPDHPGHRPANARAAARPRPARLPAPLDPIPSEGGPSDGAVATRPHAPTPPTTPPAPPARAAPAAPAVTDDGPAAGVNENEPAGAGVDRREAVEI